MFGTVRGRKALADVREIFERKLAAPNVDCLACVWMGSLHRRDGQYWLGRAEWIRILGLRNSYLEIA